MKTVIDPVFDPVLITKKQKAQKEDAENKLDDETQLSNPYHKKGSQKPTQ